MDTEIIDTIYGTFVCWRDELVARQLKAFSAHTRNEIAMLRRCLIPGDLVVDVGAHIGTYAIPLAGFVAPGGKVVAFEASPANFSLLRRNVNRNGLQNSIETVHAVVADAAGAFEMREPPNAHSGMYFFVAASGSAPELTALRLDDWLTEHYPNQSVALLKIDVEGAEFAVLRCALQTIREQLPTLYVEICPSSLVRFDDSVMDLQGLLKSLGYEFFRNVGDRNSAHDRFRIARMATLAEGGPFFDLLALHPSNGRYRHVMQALSAG